MKMKRIEMKMKIIEMKMIIITIKMSQIGSSLIYQERREGWLTRMMLMRKMKMVMMGKMMMTRKMMMMMMKMKMVTNRFIVDVPREKRRGARPLNTARQVRGFTHLNIIIVRQ